MINLFIAFLYLSLVGGQVARFTLGNNIALTLLDLFVGISVVVWSIQMLNNHTINKLTSSTIFRPLLIFVIIGLISLLLNSVWLTPLETCVSSLYLVRWVMYSGMFFIISSFSPNDKSKVINTLLLSGFSIILIGFIQFLFYSALGNLYYLGWDDHMYRLFSTFLDPNFCGAFIVMVFMITLGKFYQQYNVSKLKSVYLLFLCIISLAALSLTYSRSAFIMLAVSCFIFFAFIGKKKWLLSILIVLLIPLLLFSYNFTKENTNLFRSASSQARVESLQNVWTIILRNPVIGVGFNAYRYAQIRSGLRSSTLPVESHADAGTDNSILFVWATTGIVGVLAYIFLWKQILMKIMSRFFITKNYFYLAFFSSILGLFVDSFFINSLFYPILLAWIWIMVGVIER